MQCTVTFCYLDKTKINKKKRLLAVCHVSAGLHSLCTTLPISPWVSHDLSRATDLFHLCSVCVSLTQVFKLQFFSVTFVRDVQLCACLLSCQVSHLRLVFQDIALSSQSLFCFLFLKYKSAHLILQVIPNYTVLKYFSFYKLLLI